jgi:hypothetical protein
MDRSLYALSPYVIILLSQITSSTIEKISFCIGYSCDSQYLDSFPLEQMDEILTSRTFGSLRTVFFWLYVNETLSIADERAEIKKRMKLLDRRGLLEFDTPHML